MKPEPLPPPAADLPETIVGIWKLLSREDFDSEGRRLIDPILGADPLGILSFARDRFAAQFMNRRRSAGWDGGPARPGSNNSNAVNGYDAYFGAYRADAAAGTLTIRLEGALAPENVGMELTRDVRVVGDRLLIRLATNAADGTPITRTLTFERLT